MSNEMPDASAPLARNLELKVAVEPPILTSVRQALIAHRATAGDDQDQEDVYFTAPAGRLKLRTIRTAGNERAELIGYRRDDETASRWSSYRIAPMTAEQGAALVSVLEQALPVWVRVRKHREICLIGATRIHLDAVEELGTFIELETVLGNRRVNDAQREHQQVIDLLGLARYPVIAGSYSDLLAARHREPEAGSAPPTSR